LDYYNGRHFVLNNGGLDTTTLPQIMKNIIGKRYTVVHLDKFYSPYVLDEYLYVHSYTYFSPKRHDTGAICVQDFTYTIHHYAMSWIPYEIRLIVKVKQVLMLVLGTTFVNYLIRVFSLRKIKNHLLRKNCR
jgi:hypothetical protein